MNTIVEEVEASKYFSFSVDSTPDITHNDQLTFTIRYIKHDAQPIERFLKFVSTSSHTGLHLFDCITSTFQGLGIDINNCRGQTYDNASNVSGKYSGVQARVLCINTTASYIPCMAHSLNLSGVAAAESCPDAVNFFGFVQHVYVFLSGSTHRWTVVKDAVDKQAKDSNIVPLLPKRLSETRWSARADALRSLFVHYKTYQSVLEELGSDTLQRAETRREAMSLRNKMDKMETAFLTVFWNTILCRINETSKLLQTKTRDLCTAVALLKSLIEFLSSQRNTFDLHHQEATKFCSGTFEEKRARRAKRRADDSNEAAVTLTGKSKFKIDTFYVIVDAVVADLTRRVEA